MSSAAVMIGTLRVNHLYYVHPFILSLTFTNKSTKYITQPYKIQPYACKLLYEALSKQLTISIKQI